MISTQQFVWRILGIAVMAMLLSAAFSARAERAPIQIGAQELEQLSQDQVILIDVRRQDEWRRTGVVENSHLVTFFDQRGNYDAAAWLGKINAFSNPDDTIVLICQTGSRSGVIANWMAGQLGYSAVYNLQPGIVEWIGRGLPVSPVR